MQALGIRHRRVFNSTLSGGYNDSNQSRIVWSLLQGVRDWVGTGLTRMIARRFISRSTFAYRYVVVGLACPSMWLMADRSTPDLRSATAVLCRLFRMRNRRHYSEFRTMPSKLMGAVFDGAFGMVNSA